MTNYIPDCDFITDVQIAVCRDAMVGERVKEWEYPNGHKMGIFEMWVRGVPLDLGATDSAVNSPDVFIPALSLPN